MVGNSVGFEIAEDDDGPDEGRIDNGKCRNDGSTVYVNDGILVGSFDGVLEGSCSGALLCGEIVEGLLLGDGMPNGLNDGVGEPINPCTFNNRFGVAIVLESVTKSFSVLLLSFIPSVGYCKIPTKASCINRSRNDAGSAIGSCSIYKATTPDTNGVDADVPDKVFSISAYRPAHDDLIDVPGAYMSTQLPQLLLESNVLKGRLV